MDFVPQIISYNNQFSTQWKENAHRHSPHFFALILLCTIDQGWANSSPRTMWSATAFSVARGSIQEIFQIWNILRLVHGNVIPMGIPWETSHGMGWDGTGINCYGMGQINMSHGQPWKSSNSPQQTLVLRLTWTETCFKLYAAFSKSPPRQLNCPLLV